MTEHDELHPAMCESRTFCPGGGMGVQAQLPENSADHVVLFVLCLVLNLFYRGVQWFISEKPIIF